MKDKVNVAVIGAGYWGKKVIGEYVRLSEAVPEVELSMVCDVAEENLVHCCESSKIPKDKLARDYRVALRSKEVNAVHICTPNETHYQICRKALRANKNVLIEKPMALKAKHAWELVGVAKSRDICLQVGHIFRFNNALKLMRSLLAEEYLGDLYYAKLQWTTLMPSPLNRDIIFDLGPHPIDILNYLTNRWPAKVACKARAYRRKLLEELAYMTIEFDDELLAHVELSWLQPGKKREAMIIGSERSAAINCADQIVQIYEKGDRDSFILDVEANNTIFDEIRHFTKSILGNENRNNAGSVGARNVVVLEKLRESLEKEKTVRVDFKGLS